MSTNLLVSYTGVYQDPVTGGYPLGNGYRMYLPELMRFNSSDSWSPFGKGGIHPYAYCSGDPINHSDPSGHFSFLGIGLQILAMGLMMMPGGEIAGEAVEEGAIGGVLAANGAREGTSETIAEEVLPSPSGAAARPAEETGDLARSVEGLRLGRSDAPGLEPDPYAEVRGDLGKLRSQFDELEPRMTSRLHELFGPPGKERTIRWRWEHRDRLMALRIVVRSGEKYKDVMEGFEDELRAIRAQLEDLDMRGKRLPDGLTTGELYGEHTVLSGRYTALINEWNLHARILDDIEETNIPM